MKQYIKNLVKATLLTTQLGRNFIHLRSRYPLYKSCTQESSKLSFISKNLFKLKILPACLSPEEKFQDLTQAVCIQFKKNSTFFYSLDPYTLPSYNRPIFANYTVDYTVAIEGFKTYLKNINPLPGQEHLDILEALKQYLTRAKKENKLSEQHFLAIDSLFVRPAQSFFEALQRILFINQWLWQLKKKDIGLGHLDWLLEDLYTNDLKRKVLTREKAKDLIKDFFYTLHEHYHFKSACLVGDTGQIIILGGYSKEKTYRSNDLTRLFIEVSMEIKLPDPKVFLRSAPEMPEDLLKLALECISTGIGAPLLANDSEVIPRLIEFGYQRKDAYNYATSACWEPLIPGASRDQNNIRVINFLEPLTHLLDNSPSETFSSFLLLLEAYVKELEKYLSPILKELSSLQFEPDPYLTLLSLPALKKGKDFVAGGATYSNLGLTSVAMGATVNSLLNIKKLVFDDKKYPIGNLVTAAKKNFDGEEKLLNILKSNTLYYGKDEKEVIELTNYILKATSEIFDLFNTQEGGRFKFGLSSPGYILQGATTKASLDGRRNGEPFSVHISSSRTQTPTELLNFAASLDYGSNRLNGNVVDMIVSPDFLKSNIGKFTKLLLAAFKKGIFELQMNVIDSKTILAAQKNPELFPDLIVRVWGFSAYFKDLPIEYQDLLVTRVLQSEGVSL